MKTLYYIVSVIIAECKAVAVNIPMLIVLLGGNLAYGILYNYMYGTNVVENAPIAVVDMSDSEYSRTFIRNIDATPQVQVYSVIHNYVSAEKMMKTKEIVGILYIPDEFSLLGTDHHTATLSGYGSTLSFMDYLVLEEAVSYTLLDFNDRIRPLYIERLPDDQKMQLAKVQPIQVIKTALFNPSEGYASYLIPGVLMIVIFQTLMMCVSMMCGFERERKRLNSDVFIQAMPRAYLLIVIGKAIAYLLIYSIFSLFLLGLLPKLFNLPDMGNGLAIMAMMIPFLLGTVFFCLVFVSFYTDGEIPLFMIVFMSVLLIFLSGISYPLELMPWYWRYAHYIIPSSPATLAFIKLNCMGADLWQIKTELITLWVQCGVYFIAAVCAYKKFLRKSGFITCSKKK